MSNEISQDKNEKGNSKDGALKPDSETQHTTDPQEHMEGPISSLMKKAEDSFESEDSGDKKSS